MRSRFPIVELGKHVRQVSQRNRAEADIEVFSVTNSEGFTRSIDYFSKEVFSKDVSNYKVVDPGQFAYNPSRINVGSIDYLRHGSSVLVSPLYIVFESNKDIHADYLLRYLKSDWGNAQIRANTEGAVRDSLKFKGLESITLPLPPLDDQIRIAHLLGKVEGLIAQRKQHLQQLDDLLKSVFLEMFGDPVRNTKGWEKKTAIDYAECIVPGRDKPKSFSGATPWVTTGDLQHLGYTSKSRSEIGLSEDEIKEVRAKVVPKSSVLLTCVGDLGVVSICIADMVINQQLHAFQVSEVMSEEFFMYSLSFQKNYMYQNASQTTLPYMNKTVCNRVPMIRPPKDLQDKFAKKVRFVHGIKSRYQQSLIDLEALYGALSQQAFKGELDLSRVPMPGVTPEKEKALTADIMQAPTEQGPAIHLPVTDNVLAALVSFEARKNLLAQWLDAYRHQLGNTSFSVQHFMAAAQNRLAELHPDNDFELSANDYENIKAWVFDALAAGTLTQAFDDAGNRIELKAAQA